MQATERGTRSGRGVAVLFIVGLTFLAACIDPFTPKINDQEDIMVINGRILNQEGLQQVEVSRTSPLLSDVGYRPVSECTVEVEDNNGKVYPYWEGEEGIYFGWLEQSDLVPGMQYKLRVVTPNKRTYESDYEEMLPCPPIEDITWSYQEQSTSNTNITYQGVQFFISTNADGEFAENYLWELEESWKYLARYLIVDIYDSIHVRYDTLEIITDSVNGIFDTIVHHVRFDEVGIIWGNPDNPSDSLLTCYRSMGIPQVYTYSTKNISGGYIRNVPLNYVNNQSPRLSERYSMLVKQYSLTDRAYAFWKTLDGQSKQNGELYGTQPAKIQGNMHAADKPDEKVLGLFFASAMTEKRIFIEPDLRTLQTQCIRAQYEWPDEIMEFLSYIHPEFYPIYLQRTGLMEADYVDQPCFDCRLNGGSTRPPAFWEE